MTSFVGSETIPAIAALEEYYGANSDNELIAARTFCNVCWWRRG